MNLILRPANAKDVSILKHWDTKKHVINSGGDDDFYDWDIEVSRKVPWQEILIAELDKKPIGVIIIIDPKEEETHYWGKFESGFRAIDIWIGEELNLGKGYGTEMMRLVLNKIFSNMDINSVLVDPLVNNLKAHKFYEKQGFKLIERRKFNNDDCFVYELKRKDWENITNL